MALNKNIGINSVENMVLFLALILYLTAAIYNSGYYHPDEHFQILEFAKWKLGQSSGTSMAWEHEAMIRPTLQPILAILIIRLCENLGLGNPFQQAMVIRTLTALIMLCSLRLFYKNASQWVSPKHRIGFLASMLFFWVTPMISVRFSSETLCTACILLLLAKLFKKGKPSIFDAIWIGLLAALGFEFRYQAAFAYIGILLWGLTQRKYQFKIWFSVALTFFCVVLLCSVLDCWFYGKPVFAPYNYYHINIVDHVAASFGESPWYTYVCWAIMLPSPAIGLPMVVSICAGTIKNYKNPIVWALWSFFFIHSIISHKEIRFLFPLIPLVPIFMVWTYEMLHDKQQQYMGVILVCLLTMVNIGGLIHTVFKPAAYGNIAMIQYLLERTSVQKNLEIVTIHGSNPLRLGNLQQQFYMWQPLNIIENEGHEIKEDKKSKIIVLWQADEITRENILGRGYKEVFRTIPCWQDILNKFFHSYNKDMVLIAYEKE